LLFADPVKIRLSKTIYPLLHFIFNLNKRISFDKYCRIID
jgi:hypothetical protein